MKTKYVVALIGAFALVLAAFIASCSGKGDPVINNTINNTGISSDNSSNNSNTGNNNDSNTNNQSNNNEETTEEPKNPLPPPVEVVDYLGFGDYAAYQCDNSNAFKAVESVSLGGNKFYKALLFKMDYLYRYYPDVYANFNLDNKFLRIEGVYGHVDGSNDNPETMEIFGDDKSLDRIELKSNDFGEEFSLNVSGVNQLKIVVYRSEQSADYALAEVKLYE